MAKKVAQSLADEYQDLLDKIAKWDRRLATAFTRVRDLNARRKRMENKEPELVRQCLYERIKPAVSATVQSS
jgi:hypothetical protein